MSKNWLIRTKNNHILGPISLGKVRELIEKGSVKAEDELCSGNGYWFFVRETELVKKYVIEGIDQDFNPVSEAESVLDSPQANKNMLVPNEDDLEFPDMNQLNDNNSSVKKKE